MKKHAQLKLVDRTKLQAYLEDKIPIKGICKKQMFQSKPYIEKYIVIQFIEILIFHTELNVLTILELVFI